MPLNKAKGNMYSWVDATWNPLAGECPHRCSYCYVNAMIEKFKTLRNKYTGKPRFVEKEKNANLYKFGEGKTVFVCNMADLFAEGVPWEAIAAILKRCREHPLNTYLFQTKNPARILDRALVRFQLPPKCIFCTTVESDIHAELSQAPPPSKRVEDFITVRKALEAEEGRQDQFAITIEPVVEFTGFFPALLKLFAPDFVTIGADSKGGTLPEPSPESVRWLIAELEKFTRVIRKGNLKRLLPGE